jgi:FkbM family methyltransferase
METRQHGFRTPGGHEARMTYRVGTNDWNTLWASLNEDEYRLPRGLSGRAVDVGGYLGSVGIALALDNPDLAVTIIEPVPPNVDLIRENVALNGLGDRVTVIAGAVGKGGESVDVWYGYTGTEAAEHHGFVGNSTLAYDANHKMLPHETVTYTAIGLRDLIAEYGPLEFVKVDTEGAEWAFLSGDLSVVKTIVGEWHPVRGHTQDDLAAILVRTHDVTFTGPDEGPGGFWATCRRCQK